MSCTCPPNGHGHASWCERQGSENAHSPNLLNLYRVNEMKPRDTPGPGAGSADAPNTSATSATVPRRLRALDRFPTHPSGEPWSLRPLDIAVDGAPAPDGLVVAYDIDEGWVEVYDTSDEAAYSGCDETKLLRGTVTVTERPT